MRPRAVSLMRSGDIVYCDFGESEYDEPDSARPAIVVTSDDILALRQNTVAIVPCTTTRRGWFTEVDMDGLGVAQAHLLTTISVDHIVEETDANVGSAVLNQIRERIVDVLGI